MNRLLWTLLLLLSLTGLPRAHADYLFITEAEVLVVASSTPPVAQDGWRTVHLPRSWSRDSLHPQDTREAWYRIPLPPDVLDRGWTEVLMLRHMMNLELWVDNVFVGSGGPVSEPVEARLQRNWNRPLLWSLPGAALAGEGPHYLYVRLISEPAFGVMSPLILGTPQSLQPWYAASHFVQITLVKISLMALLLIGSLSLFLWWRTRQLQWSLLGVMSGAWALPLLYIVLPVLPVGEFTALRVIHWGVVAGATALLAFTAMFHLGSRSRALRALLLIPLLHGLLLAVVPDARVVNIGNAGQLLCQILFVGLVVKLLRLPRSRERLSVAIGLSIMLLAALHDVTLIAASSPERWRWDTPLSYITQPLMLIILAWHGIRAFLQAAAALAELNAQLRQRLTLSEQRIRQVYADQETLEREIRLEAERELVYRDLHDDLGARLLSLVYQSKKGAAQDLARTALQDLRDIVSRVLASRQPLAAVLADCMAEQLARAETLGKTLDWELDPALDEVPCDSARMLGLRLLLRELLGSVLRQNGVKSLRADCVWLAETRQLQISLNQQWQAPLSADIAQLPVLQKRLRALQAGIQTHNDHLVLRVPCGDDSTLSA